jgi:hypothetical protein
MRMQEYFFDIHCPEGVRTDRIGSLFVNAAAAKSEASNMVRQMARTRAITHSEPLAVSIVIRDDEGYVVDAIGFSRPIENPCSQEPDDDPAQEALKRVQGATK